MAMGERFGAREVSRMMRIARGDPTSDTGRVEARRCHEVPSEREACGTGAGPVRTRTETVRDARDP